MVGYLYWQVVVLLISDLFIGVFIQAHPPLFFAFYSEYLSFTHSQSKNRSKNRPCLRGLSMLIPGLMGSGAG